MESYNFMRGFGMGLFVALIYYFSYYLLVWAGEEIYKRFRPHDKKYIEIRLDHSKFDEQIKPDWTSFFDYTSQGCLYVILREELLKILKVEIKEDKK